MDTAGSFDEVRAELDQLRSENDELRERLDRIDPPSRERPSVTTRRGALAMAAAGAGGVLAGSLGAASTAEAADGDALKIGSVQNQAASPTGMAVAGNFQSYGVGITDNGLNSVPQTVSPAVMGHSNGQGFLTGLFGYVTNNINAGFCTAVYGQNDGSNTSGTLGDSGAGVRGSSGGGASAVVANGNGTGAGVDALSKSGPAVRATSATGRGVVATGKGAQVRLVPGKTASHPTVGSLAGDLFVDKSGRLWFCKVGGASATWVQLA